MIAPDRLILYLGFALLGAAMLAPRLHAARLLVGAAALAWFARSLVWTHDKGATVAAGAVLALCLFLAGRRWRENVNVRFAPEERAMVDTLFAELPKSRARHLLDQACGLWAGRRLWPARRTGDHLYYLAEGEARVISTGSQVGLCRPGDLIGELTVLSGETASATVILNSPARFWCAPADDLRPYVEAHDDVRRAIEHGFATVLKAKLRASNRMIAEAAADPRS